MSNSLAAVHPELIAEWSEKNLPLTPDSITFGSNKKVWWKGACGHEFLASACRNYKLRYDEQLLVYAQRPDATAVLEIEQWNKIFGRWVNRGARGIAVFADENRSRQRLTHSELLNSLDSGATTKITINNRRLNRLDFEQTILIPTTGDNLDEYREEYNKMLLDKASLSLTVARQVCTAVISRMTIRDIYRPCRISGQSFCSRTNRKQKNWHLPLNFSHTVL